LNTSYLLSHQKIILNNVFLFINIIFNCHTQPSLSQPADYDPGKTAFVTPAKRMSDQQGSSEFEYDEYTPYQLSRNKHIKVQ